MSTLTTQQREEVRQLITVLGADSATKYITMGGENGKYWFVGSDKRQKPTVYHRELDPVLYRLLLDNMTGSALNSVGYVGMYQTSSFQNILRKCKLDELMETA